MTIHLYRNMTHKIIRLMMYGMVSLMFVASLPVMAQEEGKFNLVFTRSDNRDYENLQSIIKSSGQFQDMLVD